MVFDFFTGVFAILGLWYVIFYPGGFSVDSINQYQQAISGNYNDWHPALQTWLVFTIPLKVFKNPGAIVLIQIIVISLVLAYMGYTLLEFGNKKYAIGALCYILFNLNTETIVMYPWKDVSFAIGACLCTIWALRNVFTEGRWMEQKGHVFLFVLVLSVTTIFRHNAVLFTVPLLFAVLLYNKRKKVVQTTVLFFIFLWLIKAPFYSILNVQSPGGRTIETMGMPMTVIGNVIKEHPERLCSETKEVLYNIATKEQWDSYICGDFNSIKFNGINTAGVEEAGTGKILLIMLECIKVAPVDAFKAFFTLTDMVYTVNGTIDWGGYYVDIAENDLGISSPGIELLQRGGNFLGRIITTKGLGKYCFSYIGIVQVLILLAILSKSTLNSYISWKRIFICMPLYLYNFGTMLLLSGNDFRFFYYSFLICPMAILLMFSEYQEKIIS